ncbi:MAG TPA: hypothetical protein VF457_16265 [Burkholderiaceae bacterium]
MTSAPAPPDDRPRGGCSLHLDDDGYVAKVPQITTVGISNLCTIESHAVTRIANSTSHYVRFLGGGDLRFAFTDQGELLELSGHGIQFHISADGAVDVRPYRAG